MSLVKIFRVFVKWPADFLMQVITLAVLNQRDAPSNKWMLLSYQPGRAELFQWWGLFRSQCRRRWVGCSSWKVICRGCVSGFATQLRQKGDLGTARCRVGQLTATHPHHVPSAVTDACLPSYWVSSWWKISQQNKRRSWFSSFTIMWGLLCATGTSTKTGQQRIWLGTAADRGRRTAHKITHQRALYEPAQTVNEWGSYSPLPEPSSFRLSNCKAFLQLTSGFILTRAVLENSWASFSFKPEKATLTAQQPWQHLKLELLQRLMLSEGTRQQIKRVPSLQKRRRRGNGPWPVSCYVDGHLSNCASRDGAELESLGLCTDRTQNGHEAEHVTLKPIRTHANKYRWMALFFFLLK